MCRRHRLRECWTDSSADSAAQRRGCSRIDRAVFIDEETIVVARRSRRHITEPDVSGNALWMPRQRIPVAAAARRLESHLVALSDAEVGDLAHHRRRLLAVSRLIDEAVERRAP